MPKVCQAAADRSGLPADRGPAPEPGAPGDRRGARALPELPEWQDPAWRGATVPGFRRALRTMHRPAAPDDLDPEGPAWSRLAYDELLAGQLALALLRAHMRAARPGTPRAGRSARDCRRPALLAHAARSSARGRRDRRGPGAAQRHAAAAAGRRRRGQDGGGDAWRRDRDRGRPPGGPDGADRNPRATAFATIEPLAAAAGMRSPSSPAASAAASATKSSRRSRRAISIFSSAPTRCFRRTWRSPISRSPSSTSSIASACISGWRSRARARPSIFW